MHCLVDRRPGSLRARPYGPWPVHLVGFARGPLVGDDYSRPGLGVGTLTGPMTQTRTWLTLFELAQAVAKTFVGGHVSADRVAATKLTLMLVVPVCGCPDVESVLTRSGRSSLWLGPSTAAAMVRCVTRSDGHITVGRVRVPLDTAREWVYRYTDVAKNSSSDQPYAYPAYDQYQGGADRPHISDGDFLAPVLLNVRLSIRSFYALQKIRGTLESALTNDDLAIPLSEIEDPSRIAAMVTPLYSVLDNPDTKP